MWTSSDVAEFSRDGLAALIANDVPAVRLAEFASVDEVEALATGLLANAIRTRSIESVTRLGISQFEQGVRGSKDEYFRLARELEPAFEKIFAASFSPLDRFIAALRRCGVDADVMSEPGYGRYWAGNGKVRIGGTPIHVDFAPQDSQGWAIADTRDQLAWNLYCRNPRGGGALRLWDKQWSPPDDVHQVAGEYYYEPDVVHDVHPLDIPVTIGDIVIVNSRTFHAVAESDDRLAFGSFISVFEDGRYRLWS